MTTNNSVQGIYSQYEKRLSERRASILHLTRNDLMLSLLRFIVFFVFILMAISYYQGQLQSLWWFLLPVIIFIGLMTKHNRVINARKRAQCSVDFYLRGIKRITNVWPGTGETGNHYHQENHPFSRDLDIFGRGSLYELLCTAKTRGGQDRLANWLTNPAKPEEIRTRQAAVNELIPRLDLWEDLSGILSSTTDPINSAELIQWASGPAATYPLALRIIAVLLSVSAFSTLIAWPVMHIGPLPFALVIVLQSMLYQHFRKQIQRVLIFARHAETELDSFYVICRRIEREQFDGEYLKALTICLRLNRESASRRIRRLSLLISLVNDGKRNKAFRPIAGLLFWSLHLGQRIEKWRCKHGKAISQWVEMISEIESLCALAGHAFENPDNVFPEIIAGNPMLKGEGLGHPLLPEKRCIRNDIALTKNQTQILVLSGSNMSGKSTLLRTIGINIALALAGATVRAHRFILTPLNLYASMRNEDSMENGYSRFYMEILHIQRMVEAASKEPMFFLVDEIFSGTNSHDRQIAAEAIISRLASAEAMGIITTHDLALAQIPGNLPCAANFHFEDEIKDGKLLFDYILRPGFIQHANALVLMRSIGLDV